MRTTLSEEDRTSYSERGIFASAVRDTKNFIMLKSRAGRTCAVCFLVIFISSILFSLQLGSFAPAFFVLFVMVCSVNTFFLGCIAKHLRRKIWPDKYKEISKMEDEMEEPSEVRKRNEIEDYPFTEEQREFLRKL